MPTGNHHNREEEWQTVLRRVLDLVSTDQLRVFHALSEYLGGELWQESERARQARLRHEAVEAIRAAAQHLGLPDGQAPTVTEFKRAAREAKLPMSFAAVYGAFDERWDLASRYYRGERIPETTAQRAMRRRYLGRRDGVREAPLAGVRLFVTQKPPPAATRTEDYEAWARDFNENPPDGYGRISENPWHISTMLGLGWDRILEVASGRKELTRAQQEELTANLSEAGPLVGHRLASQMLGLSPHARHAKQPSYPQPVVCLGGSNWLWLRSDIEGYGAGRRDFTHERGALQAPRPWRHHLAQALRHALHLEVAAAITGARAHGPPGQHQRVGHLRAKQGAALQGRVVAKPVPRVRRHQPSVRADHPDHEVVDVQLRSRRPITPGPPGGHMQRRRDGRSRRRLPDPHAVLAAAVNDRLVAGHVLHRALRCHEQRVLDRPPVGLVGHRPQHRDRLGDRQRHLHVCDAGYPLYHRSSLVIQHWLAVLVARLALERSGSTELIAGLHVLALEHRDQLLALDRIPTSDPELGQRSVGAEPQRRAPFSPAVKRLRLQLVVGAREGFRCGLGLQAIVASAGRVGVVADLDDYF